MKEKPVKREKHRGISLLVPIVMAYWGAANTETAYGKTDFEMQVIGFPSDRGQMPVMPMTGFGIC